jgi:hypothetical protein
MMATFDTEMMVAPPMSSPFPCWWTPTALDWCCCCCSRAARLYNTYNHRAPLLSSLLPINQWTWWASKADHIYIQEGDAPPMHPLGSTTRELQWALSYYAVVRPPLYSPGRFLSLADERPTQCRYYTRQSSSATQWESLCYAGLAAIDSRSSLGGWCAMRWSLCWRPPSIHRLTGCSSIVSTIVFKWLFIIYILFGI